MSGFYAVVLAACLGMSFFLSGMEAGVFALSRIRIRRLIREGSAQARLLHQYLENPEDFLWTILVGNTLANFVVVALAVLAMHDWMGAGSAWFWLAFLPVGLAFYAVCDLLPKMLFRQYPNRLCLAFAPAFRVAHFCLQPAVWPLARFSRLLLRWSGGRSFSGRLFGSRDELRQLMQESARQMTSEERTLIDRVLDLQSLTVGRVMMPMARVAAVNIDAPLREVWALCRERDVTRLPVWREDSGRRRVAGLLNARSLLYEPAIEPDQKAGKFLKPAIYLDAGLRLEEALRQLQHSGQRLAIVLDREKVEVGVISLHDILKVVFGDFHL